MLGIDPATLPAPDQGEGIWAENMPALDAFLTVCGQWRMTANGRFLGLDYTAVRAGLDLAGLTLTPEVWADVQVIEGAARRALNGN